MPDITNPQAVLFCNQRVRPASDKLAQAYYDATAVLNEWTSFGGTTLIPNTADPVIDGSAQDGRSPITGADVSNLVNRLSELTTDYNASGAAKLNTVLKVAVNPQR
jgi:hypothetical protein